jgi:ribonuclease HI
MIYLNNSDLIFEGYKQYQNIKNSELEKMGIQLCLEKCQEMDSKKDIAIYTDCESAIGNIQLPNNAQLKWVKGHSKKSEKDEFDLKFQICDKKAREKMRELA